MCDPECRKTRDIFKFFALAADTADVVALQADGVRNTEIRIGRSRITLSGLHSVREWLGVAIHDWHRYRRAFADGVDSSHHWTRLCNRIEHVTVNPKDRACSANGNGAVISMPVMSGPVSAGN